MHTEELRVQIQRPHTTITVRKCAIETIASDEEEGEIITPYTGSPSVKHPVFPSPSHPASPSVFLSPSLHLNCICICYDHFGLFILRILFSSSLLNSSAHLSFVRLISSSPHPTPSRHPQPLLHPPSSSLLFLRICIVRCFFFVVHPFFDLLLLPLFSAFFHSHVLPFFTSSLCARW